MGREYVSNYFGEYLRECRLKQGLKLKDICDKRGRSINSLSRCENGSTFPRIHDIKRWCDDYNISDYHTACLYYTKDYLKRNKEFSALRKVVTATRIFLLMSEVTLRQILKVPVSSLDLDDIGSIVGDRIWYTFRISTKLYTNDICIDDDLVIDKAIKSADYYRNNHQ